MESDEQQIEALLRLIDDPDHEVYTTVANKILDYGSGIIPRLESLWERTPNESVQERLEMLIHRVHFDFARCIYRMGCRRSTGFINRRITYCPLSISGFES